MKTRAQVLAEHADRALDKLIADRMASAKLAAPIPPTARVKLKSILKKYARDPHPFTACVRDNMSKYGPGRTEAVCATLKGVIKGVDASKTAPANASEGDAVIDADVLLALDAISEIDLQEIFLEAVALEQYGTVEAVALLNVDGRAELQRWGDGSALELAQMDAKARGEAKKGDFVFPDEKAYPIHDRKHGANALARAQQNETGDRLKKVQDAVCSRYSDLPFCQARKGGSSS